MSDLSQDELERLRKLEEEVDRERAEIKKRQEDAEKKAAADCEAAARERAVIEKPETTAVAKSPVDRRGIRNKILVGAGAVMGALFLIQNMVTIIGMGVLLGAGYVGLNKYFVGQESPSQDDPDA